MNYQILFKALKFVCLPTLSLIVLLFFGFFSISKTIDFISGNSGLAIFLRIICFVGELVLVIIMYYKYLKEDILKNAEAYKNKTTPREIYNDNLRSIFNASSKSHYRIYDTGDSDILIIERIEKSDNY